MTVSAFNIQKGSRVDGFFWMELQDVMDFKSLERWTRDESQRYFYLEIM